MYRQRPVKGGRAQLPACVLQDIRHEVEAVARRYDVSRSFVIATTLAKAFGIRGQEDFTRAKAAAKKRANGRMRP